MREAVIGEAGALLAPAVGRWRPAVGLGAPVGPGVVLGWLVRVGRELEVRAPAGISGVATQVVPAGTFVPYGEPLLTVGEAQGTGFVLAGASGPAAEGPEGAVAVRAETDGTVYLSPEPGAPPFVTEGGLVEAHQTVALVEVMKTFTPARAAVGGTVVRVDVRNGDAVREGAPLVWVRPG